MIKDTNKIPALTQALDDAKERILRKAGSFMEGEIKNTITEGKPDWRPLKPATIKRKKSSKPLMDTGHLRNSITHKVEKDKDRVLVGIFSASAEAGDTTGDEAVMIAAVHEFGSPKQKIPKRSYIRSTFDDKKDVTEKLIEAEVNKILKRYS